ncbi:NAD(P)/FAD-dependent oxidoreductase [Paenibacillus sp. DXFW5]|uniref:NAD(P)/FAD-dependent oxidoreductase n=1 Tax=Paenibacillus rhizolycopersici TaxID=2780073 RepID=A0ABS2HBK7_9BACL|nr:MULTISPECIES: NAD(P)/FAD-dependent oxidoreductase [Paenibacillus]MBM6996923.1 NAD(P)/FAD-dependent oxidoreductase [Paenibacillus rhizolycopersici]MUG88896.1 pyridine nucleotide-disulfide oxidoreductase [Paenibacillus timonensis]
MEQTKVYDCLILGGGIAGLQAAIQLGRYSAHQVLVIDAGFGRSTLCQQYHNLLGFPEGISGQELRNRGRRQAESYGVEFVLDTVTGAEKREGRFQVVTLSGTGYTGKTVLLATGVLDRFPDVPGMVPTLGLSVYVCPDCDGYEIQDRKTVLMGAGRTGAEMALLLAERTRDLTYINHERSDVAPELLHLMAEREIRYEEGEIVEVQHTEGFIRSVMLKDGRSFAAERGFIAFGGNEVHSRLAAQLGVPISGNRHVETDPRTKQTSVPGVWAAGDLGVHAEQVSVAMGEGSIAAIWIHKALSPCYNQLNGGDVEDDS